METKKLFALVIIASIFEIVALTFLTRYATMTTHYLDLVPAVLIYALVVPYVLLHLVEAVGMGFANFIWNICTTILAIIVGYYYFNEKIDKLHIISLFLGILSLILLAIAHYSN